MAIVLLSSLLGSQSVASVSLVPRKVEDIDLELEKIDSANMNKESTSETLAPVGLYVLDEQST